VSFICAVIWQMTNLPTAQSVGSLLLIWNTIVRLGILGIISLLISEVHSLLKSESELSHTDFLTGVSNRRALEESAASEMERLTRTDQPFSILYVDVDNFKAVNDNVGHKGGDAVLLEIANMLKLQLRGFDVVARIGGDEYVVLLPGTDQEAARRVAPRVQASLLREINAKHLEITLSFGVLTCTKAPETTQELFHMADQTMYRAKKEGKGTICYDTYSG
jgi:diguanylate cyclase (GGDEF)-like protein